MVEPKREAQKAVSKVSIDKETEKKIIQDMEEEEGVVDNEILKIAAKC